MRKAGLFALAAATLMLETSLLRAFALAHGYHYAFLTISIALLGTGAGGSVLQMLLLRWPERVRVQWVIWCGVGFSATSLAGYGLANWVPLDLYRISWRLVQVFFLLVTYLVLALPFLCTGLGTALLLHRDPDRSWTYAANLMGSAVGTLAGLGALGLGPGAAVAISAGLGGVATILFAREQGDSGRGIWAGGLAIVLAVGAALAPAWRTVRLSPYRPLSYALQLPDAQLLSSKRNVFSRVDVIQSSALHVSPGLSLQYGGRVPIQHGLYIDGDARSAILDDDVDLIREWGEHLPLSLAFLLRLGGDALVLEPGGGIDLAVAESVGAARVTAVTANPLVAQAVVRFGSFGDSSNVEWRLGSQRSVVRDLCQQGDRFDVVDLALDDSQQAVVSGAFSLNEEYRYTLDALQDDLCLLKPEGILVLQRWLQTPPSESLRAWALAVEAVERSAELDPRSSLAAIRSWSTALILIKNGPWDVDELTAIRRFCSDRRFDLVYLPDMSANEANRYHRYPGAPYWVIFGRLLDAGEREAFFREHTHNVRPPRDDWPFFFNFFRWRQLSQVWQQLGRTWQPFGGGGYLVLLALLVTASLSTATLILLPAFMARTAPGAEDRRRHRAAFLCFGCLGAAYMAVEIPFIQLFVLVIGHSVSAFSVVAATLLVSSGVGSLVSGRLGTQPMRWAVPALIGYLGLLIGVMLFLKKDVLGFVLSARVAFSVFVLAPLGLLMGVPFATGLELLGKEFGALVPWVWTVNSCASVLSSIVIALLTMDLGVWAVLGLAAALYAAAWASWALWRRERNRGKMGGVAPRA